MPPRALPKQGRVLILTGVHSLSTEVHVEEPGALMMVPPILLPAPSRICPLASHDGSHLPRDPRLLSLAPESPSLSVFPHSAAEGPESGCPETSLRWWGSGAATQLHSSDPCLCLSSRWLCWF